MDGVFFYSVKTTGVYCFPSCPSRGAKFENVAFHRTRGEAERAGFRPCKRCKPDGERASSRQAKLVATVCRWIESRDEKPTLDEMANVSGLSSFHFHRLFKSVTGVTPKAFVDARHFRRAHDALRTSKSVTEAIYDAGYSGPARFYERSNARLGMTPTRFRSGANGVSIRFAIGECSLGSILVAMSTRGVCAILLGDDPQELAHDLERRFPRAELLGGNRLFERSMAKVIGLVDDPRAPSDLPLDIRGTAFQERVWKALLKIPAGKTTTYSRLARSIGAPSSVRAVASAVGANPLAVAIPCHRVVRTDGNISGYRWGVERKRALLERERSQSRSAKKVNA